MTAQGQSSEPFSAEQDADGLHPDFQRFVDDIAARQNAGAPRWECLSAQQLRQLTKTLRSAASPDITVERRDLTVAGAVGELPARLYTPPEWSASGPALIYFHGGGFSIGDIDTHDGIAARLAANSRAAILSVDYRLGPENRFPAAHDDSLAATKWVFAHSEALGFARDAIAVGGDSAGANLAASTCIALRNDAEARCCLQLLIYPNTTILGESGSRARFAEGYYLTTAAAHHLFSFYVDPADATDPRIDLLQNRVLSGLPDTVLVLAGCDILFDEGRAYGEALKSQGVGVEEMVFPGMIHGFLGFADQVPTVADAFTRIGQTLSSRLTRK